MLKYRKSEAKSYAREHFRGVWAPTMTRASNSRPKASPG